MKTKAKKAIKSFKHWYSTHNETAWIAIVGIFLAFAFVQDVFPFLNPNSFMILKYSDPEDLFINLFTIQSTIAALSLAVIALATGIIDKEFYGISVTEYITRRRNKIFSHKDLLVIDMLITAINYFVLSKNCFNVSIIIFIVSILISIKLIKDVYLVFCGNDNMKKEIGNYIINNPSAEMVDTIALKTIKSIDQLDLYNIVDNCDLINKLYLESNSADTEVELRDSIAKYYADLFNASVKSENTKLSFILVDKILALYKHSDCDSAIWEKIIESYYILFSRMSYQDFSDNATLINDFYSTIYKKHDERYYVLNRYYFNLYYSLIYENENIPARRKEALKERIFGTLLSRVTNLENTISDLHTAYALVDFFRLLTFLIDKKDTRNIEKVYLSRIKYRTTIESVGLTFLFLTIYLYYATTRCDNNQNEKEYASLIEAIKNTTKYVFFRKNYYEFVLKYFDYLQENLEAFEHLKIGRIQAAEMSDVFLQCISFIVLSSGVNSSETFLKGMNKDIVVQLATIFVGKKKDETKSNFDDFSAKFIPNNYKLFGISYKAFTELLEKASKEIEKERVAGIDNQYSNEYLRIIEAENLKQEKTVAEKFTSNTCFNSFLNKKEAVFCYEINTYKDMSLLSDEFSFIRDNFTQFLINNISECININRAKWVETNNYTKLTGLASMLDLGYDTLIADRGMFWDLDDDGFKNYFGKLKIEEIADSISLMIDSTTFGINIVSVKAEEHKFTIDEIPCKKISENEYKYKDLHSIPHTYSELELVNHFNSERVRYRISSKVEFYFTKKFIGVGIENTFED